MNPVTIARIAVMIIGGIIAIVGMNKHKQGAGWGQPLAVVGAILAIIAALWGIKRTIAGDDRKELRARELAYQRLETRVLGKYIAANFSGKKVVIVKDSMRYAAATSTGAEVSDEPLAGLKEGLGSAVTIVKEILPNNPSAPKQAPAGAPAGMPPMMMPQEMWYTTALLAKDLPAESSYDIIIFMSGMPSDTLAGGSKIKNLLGKKKIAMVGGALRLYPQMFQKGYAVAAAIYNPKADYDDAPMPSNEQKAFDRRFLLITQENYQQIVNENQNTFQF